MQTIKIFIFTLLLTGLASCHKEDIKPNHRNGCEDSAKKTESTQFIGVQDVSKETTNEFSRAPQNGTTIGDGSETLDDGGITDPNSDEDQNRKKKPKN